MAKRMTEVLMDIVRYDGGSEMVLELGLGKFLKLKAKYGLKKESVLMSDQ